MDEPTVLCVMLTRDRPAMARRAVECFRRQTYPAKRLLVLDSGLVQIGFDSVEATRGEFYVRGERGPIMPTIGELRNMANGLKHFESPDILIHWDDDDWSHPARIAEQVALLQGSEAAAVGYHEMLFWREPQDCGEESCRVAGVNMTFGEAWLYTGSILGTSLCYWRETWERVPFRATRLNPNHQQGTGEDADFLTDLAAKGMCYVSAPSVPMGMEQARALAFPEGPRMIAAIHGANTSQAYDPDQMRAHPQHWTRVPAWDQFCLETMKI